MNTSTEEFIHEWIKNLKHDRSYFYKYTSIDTAFKVLQAGKLRWSSPTLFNDPFDVPREITVGLEPYEISNALKKIVISTINNPTQNAYSSEPSLKDIGDIALSISDEQKNELINNLENNSELFEDICNSLRKLSDIWREMLPNLRILCLTESPEHAAMWYHYSDKYRGVVFEFKCDATLDNPWKIAKPVMYPDAKPSIYSASGWADLTICDPDTASTKIFNETLYTKARDWEYEKEWRIVNFKNDNDHGLYTDYPFGPEELTGIYLGPEISKSNQNRIYKLSKHYPNVKLLNTKIGMNREFIFTEV